MALFSKIFLQMSIAAKRNNYLFDVVHCGFGVARIYEYVFVGCTIFLFFFFFTTEIYER